MVDLTLEIAIDDDTHPSTAKRSLDSAFPPAASGDAPSAAAAAAGAPPPAPPPATTTTTNTRPSKRIALRLQRQAQQAAEATDAKPEQDDAPSSEDEEEEEEEEDAAAADAPAATPPPPPRPQQPKLPVSGPALAARLAALQRACSASPTWPPGTPVWVRIQGFSQPWPGCVFSVDDCRRGEVPAIYFAAAAAAPRLWGARAEGFDDDGADGGEEEAPPAPLLVRWYGEHTSSWISGSDIVGPLVPGTADYARRSANLSAHGRRTGRGKLAQAALRETDGAVCAAGGPPGDEAARVRRLGYERALAVAAKLKKDKAKGRKAWRGGGKGGGTAGGAAAAKKGGGSSNDNNDNNNARAAPQPPPPPPRSKKLQYKRWRAEQEQRRAREALTPQACSSKNPPTAAEVAAGVGSAWALCPCCSDDGTDVACAACGRAQHVLCAKPPVLGRAYVNERDRWACASCGAESKGLGALARPGGALSKAAASAAAAANAAARATAANAGGGAGDQGQGAVAAEAATMATTPITTAAAAEAPAPTPTATATAAPTERMGLTPPWLIATVAYKVFGLSPPTRDRPYIAGLLDPCANSLTNPNVPAELLYDRHTDGLAERNSWQRLPFIWCNPDFSSTVQWRFVNRCSNEIEGGLFETGGSGGGGSGRGARGNANANANATPTNGRHLRAIALLTRNSTDTSFFQRLRCFPRVYLRRNAMRFSDYEKTPIGFGVCLFLLAPIGAPWTPALIQRFYEHLSPYGEPGVPVDLELVRSVAFMRLLSRLQVETERDHRDHFAQCDSCRRWRAVDHGIAAAIKRAGQGSRWTCSELVRANGSRVTCRTPLTRAEANMLAAAAKGAALLEEEERARGGGGGGGGGGNDDSNGNDAVRSMGGYDWRRKAVVRKVVEAIVASVLRKHGEEPPPPSAEQHQPPAKAPRPHRPPYQQPRAATPSSPYPSADERGGGNGGGNDSDSDVPLEELRQRAERMAAERTRDRRARERRELLSHLQPGMPAARLLGSLALASAAGRAERDALTAEAELEAAEAANPRSTAGREAASAEARRERAARLADLYLAASLAARELSGADGQEHAEEEADAVARAMLPGCSLEVCAAVLGPPRLSAPPPPAALVRRRGQVLARLAAAYLCRCRSSSLFPTHDQAMGALRRALLQQEPPCSTSAAKDDDEDDDRAASSAAALSALQLLAPWLLLATPPLPTSEEAREAHERDVLRAPALLLLRPSAAARRPPPRSAAAATTAGDVAPCLDQVFAAALKALEPRKKVAAASADQDEEEEQPPSTTAPENNNDDNANGNAISAPGRLRLLAERAVRSSPDAATRALLSSRPDLLLEVAALWRDEAEHRQKLEATRKEQERREARRALAARVIGSGGDGEGGSSLARLAAPPSSSSLLLPPLRPGDLARLPSSAAQVACLKTLEARTALPDAARAALEQSERARERARQQRALEARLKNGGEDNDHSSSSSSSDDEDNDNTANKTTAVERACLRVLDPLELARLARSAANQSLLQGLGMQLSALTSELVPAVEADDPLTQLASRRLASRAAAERWARRAHSARRELETRGMARLRVLRRCREELAAAVAAEERARASVDKAEAQLARVQSEAAGGGGGGGEEAGRGVGGGGAR
jgi:hypothetical protein